ncbi:MAG: GNAT family N-acetyltransferase [Saprospiraceae bacterium]|nr:GNAT family N-acetyltransferase [Saprospiraceae bacterium]
MNHDLTYQSFIGAKIVNVFEPLAALRIAVFQKYPYLYEGTLEYELDYLKTYANSPRSLLFAVFDGDQMVGATTALPLTDETEEVQAPFVAAGYRLEDVFYFGESILLPEYRGLGLGHRFFDEREKHVRSFGRFKYTSFCAVQRPDDHPARPSDYQPLDVFWKKRGYVPMPVLTTQFSWPDLGETESTPKTMLFWLKEL